MAQIKLNATYGLTGNLPALNASALTTINASNISSGTLASARFSGGKILQVISKTITSNYSMTSGTTADVTGLTQAITMASASNHLLVLGNYVFRNGGNSATVNPGANVFITDSSNN